MPIFPWLYPMMFPVLVASTPFWMMVTPLFLAADALSKKQQ